MAISKDKKHEIVDDIAELVGSSKMTVVANYPGTSVKAMQSLRRSAAESRTSVKVVKNRLFRLALAKDDKFSNLDQANFRGQLLYAFNSDDEVAPAQNLADFAKGAPQLTFVGAINADGHWLPAEDVKALASLPAKDQLRGQLVGTLAAPLSDFANVLTGNIRGLFNSLNARSAKIQ